VLNEKRRVKNEVCCANNKCCSHAANSSQLEAEMPQRNITICSLIV